MNLHFRTLLVMVLGAASAMAQQVPKDDARIKAE